MHDMTDHDRAASIASASLYSGDVFESKDDYRSEDQFDGLFSDEDWLEEEYMDGYSVSSIQSQEISFGYNRTNCGEMRETMSSDNLEVLLASTGKVLFLTGPQPYVDATGCGMQYPNQSGVPIGEDVNELDLEVQCDDSASLAQVCFGHNAQTAARRSSPSDPIHRCHNRRRRDDELAKRQNCTHCFGHGLKTTIFTVVLVWAATLFSVLARQSTHFLVLREPLYITPLFEPVTHVGLLHMELCFNQTFEASLEGCRSILLSASMSNDITLILARLCVASSCVCGAFFALLVTSSIFWESIEMKPIGVGLIFTYFLQSFAMLAFDSSICDTHRCSTGQGCYMSIAASICWLGACIGTAKMDVLKWKQQHDRRRLNHEANGAREAAKGCTEAGTITPSDSSTSDDQDMNDTNLYSV